MRAGAGGKVGTHREYGFDGDRKHELRREIDYRDGKATVTREYADGKLVKTRQH